MSKKPSWFYRQSGVIPFRREADRLEILLITSSSGKRWGIPKGIVEQHLTPAESAAQEALEEAGVAGVVGADPVGEYQYDKWGGTCVVAVYLMAVREILETWPEADVRQREWVLLEDAPHRVGHPDLKRLLACLSPSDFQP